MIEDLSVDCGIIRVRSPDVITPPTPPKILFALGIASIFGFILLSKVSYIPLTTGKLGGKIVGINK